MDFTIRYTNEPARPTAYKVEFNGPQYHRSWQGIALSHSTFTFSDIQALGDWVATWDNEPPLFGWTIKSIEKIGEPGQ